MKLQNTLRLDQQNQDLKKTYSDHIVILLKIDFYMEIIQIKERKIITTTGYKEYRVVALRRKLLGTGLSPTSDLARPVHMPIWGQIRLAASSVSNTSLLLSYLWSYGCIQCTRRVAGVNTVGENENLTSRSNYNNRTILVCSLCLQKFCHS